MHDTDNMKVVYYIIMNILLLIIYYLYEELYVLGFEVFAWPKFHTLGREAR